MACSVVWAEVRAWFPDDESCADSLRVLGIRFDAPRPEAAPLAGRLWKEHCTRKGTDHRRVVADRNSRTGTDPIVRVVLLK